MTKTVTPGMINARNDEIGDLLSRGINAQKATEVIAEAIIKEHIRTGRVRFTDIITLDGHIIRGHFAPGGVIFEKVKKAYLEESKRHGEELDAYRDEFPNEVTRCVIHRILNKLLKIACGD